MYTDIRLYTRMHTHARAYIPTHIHACTQIHREVHINSQGTLCILAESTQPVPPAWVSTVASKHILGPLNQPPLGHSLNSSSSNCFAMCFKPLTLFP